MADSSNFQIRGPTCSAKVSVSKAVVRTWHRHRAHVIRGRPKGSSVAFGDEMDVISQVGRHLTPHTAWRTKQASFELHSPLNRSQCSWHSTGVMWSRRLAPVTRRAAAFCSDWTLLMTLSNTIHDHYWLFLEQTPNLQDVHIHTLHLSSGTVYPATS